LGNRKILNKTGKQQQGPEGFDDQGKKQNPFENNEKIPPGGVEEGRLDNLPPAKGYAASHETEEQNGKGDDSQPPDLKEQQGNELTGQRQILADIDDGQPRNADRRGGGKKGIDKTEGFAA